MYRILCILSIILAIFYTLEDNLPRIFTWEPAQGGCVPIRKQDGCGSCWAHATACALQMRLGRSGFTMETDIELIQNVWGNHGCSGGLLDRAFHHCKLYGLQYNDSRLKLRGYKDFAGSGIRSIKTEIFTNGPVAAHFVEYPSLRSVRPDIAWAPSHYETWVGYHAVAIIGWDDDIGGWLVQNSWGTEWSKNGLGYISYGAGDIETMAVLAGYF
jgi:Papain family cysteine protease